MSLQTFFCLIALLCSLCACQFEGWAKESCYLLPSESESVAAVELKNSVTLESQLEAPWLAAEKITELISEGAELGSADNAALGYDFTSTESAEESARAASSEGTQVIEFATQVTAMQKAEGTEAASACIDIRTADVEALRALPGVGLKRAEQIVAARQRRPFKQKADLRRIKGIGKQSFARMKDKICPFS